MIPVALSLLVALVVGFLFVSLLWPAGRHFRDELLLRVCLGAGLGPGVTSCLLFVWLLARGRADRSYVVFELTATALLLAVFILRARRSNAVAHTPHSKTARARPTYVWLLTAALCVASAATALYVALALMREPHGNGWDAWAIYGLRARAIFRGGADWADAFSGLIPWSHPDYPLLLPLSTSRVWLYCGRETAAAQAAMTALFTAATVGTVSAALASLRSRAQGLLAGVVILGFTMFVNYGVSAYADVPVTFFCAATFVLFALGHASGGDRPDFLALAGAAAGLAAWTKNEGLLFAVCVVVAHAVVTIPARGARVYARQLAGVALGLAPVLAAVLYFKLRLAPPSELVAAMGSQTTLGKVLDRHRWAYVAREFWRQIVYYCGRGVNLAYLLAAHLVCFGATLKHGSSLLHLSLTLGLLLAGYFWVYLTTPWDLVFHVKYSMDRLLMQQWPGFVFLFFLAARTPEESFGGEARAESLHD